MTALEEGSNPMLLRRGIEDATELVVAELRRHARDVSGADDLEHVATIAAKEDERIGVAVASALHRVGPEGVVTIEEATVPGIEVEFVEGFHVENGHFSPYLIHDTTRMETVFDDPYVLLTNEPLSHINDLMPTLDAVIKSPRALVIFAEKVEGAALGLIVQNNQHGTLKAVVVRAPGFGHRRIAHLHDLAAFTGGQVIAKDAGLTLQHVTPDTFGRARRIVISEGSTVLIEGAGSAEDIRARLGQIRVELQRATQETDIEVLRERLAKLASSLAVIHVGAATGPELQEKFRRTEGAVAATRTAVTEGIVAGGGTAPLRPSRRCRTRRWLSAGCGATTCAAPTWSEASYPSRCSGSRPTPASTVRRDRPGPGDAAGPRFERTLRRVRGPVRRRRDRPCEGHPADDSARGLGGGVDLTTEARVAEELIAQPGAVIAPGFGDLAEGLARPSSPA
jgi:chaperonin GroEL